MSKWMMSVLFLTCEKLMREAVLVAKRHMCLFIITDKATSSSLKWLLGNIHQLLLAGNIRGPVGKLPDIASYIRLVGQFIAFMFLVVHLYKVSF
jgi:hypothetical protein